jgi:oxalate decarboxylase
MKMILRRQIFEGGANGGFAPGSVASTASQAAEGEPTAQPFATAPGSTPTLVAGAALSPFKYALERQADKPDSGDSSRQAQGEFPISATMTGAVLILKPGAMRELHWHPNANELQYYARGKARMTVIGWQGRPELVDFDAGDLGYVPQGYGHAIENVGTEDLLVILTFDSGDCQEISLTDWLSQTLPRVLAANFGAPESSLGGFPNEELFITNAKRG